MRAGRATMPNRNPNEKMRTIQVTAKLRLWVTLSSLSIAMKRCSTRCDPNAPSPQPAVERTNTAVMVSFPAPVNGLRNPAGCPSPLNGEVVVKMSVSGRMMKHESITID